MARIGLVSEVRCYSLDGAGLAQGIDSMSPKSLLHALRRFGVPEAVLQMAATESSRCGSAESCLDRAANTQAFARVARYPFSSSSF